jgi:hypothetical protein
MAGQSAMPSTEETAPSKGAPIKEAEALVPKLELPKAVAPSPHAQNSSISHNL